MDLKEKIDKVKNIIKDKRIVIAFSGGADSTLMAYIAKDVAKEVITVSFDNGLMPSNFSNNLKSIAKSIGINNILIEKKMLKNDNFNQNSQKRCFICRSIIYAKIKEIATENNISTIVDGTNVDDLFENRPGIMVNYEIGVISPFVMVGLGKDEVLKYLKEKNMNYLKATTCLSTRIETGEKITKRRINMIRYGEDFLKSILNTDALRVRYLANEMALIELVDINPLLNKNKLQTINNEFKAVKFKNVALNIEPQIKEKKELIYKPCKDEANKLMFENDLPYQIDIKKTCKELEKIGEVKCSPEMSVAMLDSNGKNLTLFGKGKMVIRKIEDKKDVEKFLIKILPLIRPEI